MVTSDPPEFAGKTIPELIAWAITNHQDMPAIIDGPLELTYKQLEAHICGVVLALRKQGIKEGDRVMIWSANDWQWVVAALSTWWLGAVLVPFSERLMAMEVEDLLARIKPSFVFLGSGNQPYQEYARVIAANTAAFDSALSRVYWGTEGETPLGCIRWNDFVEEPEHRLGAPLAVDPGSLCEILSTSGTTGRPKCVMHGHTALIRVAEYSRHRFTFTAIDTHKVLVNPSLSHSYGINMLLSCLANGAAHVLAAGWQADMIAALIEKHRVTHVSGPPPLLQWLWNENIRRPGVLSSLRSVGTSGTFIPPDLIRNYIGLGLSNLTCGYGMTESPHISRTPISASEDVVCTTVGKTRPGVRVTLLDEFEKPVGDGEVGEIVVDSDSNMLGYLDDPEATALALTVDGQLKTGDMGQWTPDGMLKIVGRKKDMFICFGLNVYPAEVECQLLASGLLADVAVVERDNKFAGQEGVAFLVPKFPDVFELSELRSWVRSNMASFKQPSSYHLLELLPRNANGKVDKNALRKDC